MKCIHKENSGLIKILEHQVFDKSKNYRYNNFVIEEQIDNKLVLFNNMLKSAYVLNKEEAEAYHNKDFSNKAINTLFKNWYFVPDEFKEAESYEQIRTLNAAFAQGKADKCNFVIFTTTDCNARCYYCYEKGCEKLTMDDQTANDVADFIIKLTPNKEAGLSWFGGEPLHNYKVIDIITKKLKENNIKYSSSMTSNGYAFNKELVKKAKELWHLKKVQITLDGTEDVYNKTKNYKEATTSPFKTVINNIDKLTKIKIRVTIRLNLSKNNLSDTENLIDYLAEKYYGNKYVGVYCCTLFQELDKNNLKKCYKQEFKLENKLHNYNLSVSELLYFDSPMNHCMADSDFSCAIMPNGDLSSCEHFTENTIPWGNIYNDKINLDLKNSWRKRYPINPKCNKCAFFPNCNRLIKCPNSNKNCPSEEAAYRNKFLHYQLINTFIKTAY